MLRTCSDLPPSPVAALQQIEYEEFLAATVHTSKLEMEDNLRTAFANFDKDGSGAITKDELREALKHTLGGDPEELEQLVREADSNGDGVINFEEFCALMRGKKEDEIKESSAALRKKKTHSVKM